MPNDPGLTQHDMPADSPATAATAAQRLAPAPVGRTNRRSMSRAAWFALVVGVVALIFMLVFILQNNVATEFVFLAWAFTIPLGVAVLFAAIGGALITAMVGTVRMVVLGRNVRKLEKDRALPA